MLWSSLSRGSPASGDSWKMDTGASMFCHNNWCAIKIAHQSVMGHIPSALGLLRIMAHGSQGPMRKWIILNLWTLKQQYMLSVLHSQYYACWWTGDFRSQWISRHGIDCQSWNIPSSASEELILNLTKSHSSITSPIIVKSFQNFAQSIAVPQSCSV